MQDSTANTVPIDGQMFGGLFSGLHSFIPLIVVVVLAALVFFAIQKKFAKDGNVSFLRSALYLVAANIFLVMLVLVLPVQNEVKKQIFTLLGINFTVMMAFSSTSFVGNAVSGLMLRGINNFMPGDFIRVNSYFGRVSERGFFHTEIQTEDRDLTTIPNLFLVSNPVTVIRASGTVVSAEVSLGYDIAIDSIETALLDAAERTGLSESFVQIKSLDDFSVVYRVAGILVEVKQILSIRSLLRRNMIRALHGAGIEIVSPTFMTQRQMPLEQKLIGSGADQNSESDSNGRSPEAMIFDKAELAEQREILSQRRVLLTGKIEQLESDIKESPDDTGELEYKLETLKKRLDFVERTATRFDGEAEQR